ncbi:tripartite tricarboxylate transporter TctB family protein [Brevibacterium sanguinis]|uniref:Tripartite tricarboxylate transporter TctB family protein n=2 Tax=Brevibacterium TaxID=1696 RepID=A0A366IJT7_9MICO|nr:MULTISPECIES: tripartite tricarboxylate transporter TctB family protein [Brevibacterium]RBP64991.1 tripartite tricarboxylate transporter TctB family protein [Brevibacterium sanguinis]RBP71254.1 tripartite tricarboxylate transporter TctB family protein [Brevibacterium celere]
MVRSLTAARRGDIITGSVIVVIGVVYYSATFAIQRTDDIITPATFPAIVGIALILLGGALVVTALVRKGAEAGAGLPTADVPDASELPGGAASAGIRDEDAASAVSRDDAASASTVVIEAPAEPAARRVVLQFALFFAYLAILIPVGFLLATAAFLMALTSIYAPDRWLRNLIFSVLFSAVVYFAFVYGLAVYLPVGILG